MKNVIVLGMMLLLITFSCQKETLSEEVNEVPTDTQISDKKNTEALLSLIHTLQDTEIRNQFLQNLGDKSEAVSLAWVVSDLESKISKKGFNAWSSLRAHVDALDYSNKSQPLEAKVPEIWIYNNKNLKNNSDLLFMYISEDKKKDSEKTIPAYDIMGNKVLLSTTEAPKVPVVIIDNMGSLSFDLQMKVLNTELKKLHINKDISLLNSQKNTKNTTLSGKTILKSMKLKKAHEPWFRGPAEIYAIVIGLKDDFSKTERQLEYHYPEVNYTKVNYQLGATVINWRVLGYRYANIQFMEHDQGNIGQIMAKIAEIALDNRKKPSTKDKSNYDWVKVLGTIFLNVIGGIFNGADDNVDEFPLIEYGKQYSNITGARNNATITLEYKND